MTPTEQLLRDALEALLGIAQTNAKGNPLYFDAGYCEVCGRNAPKDVHGNLEGKLNHRDNCPVGLAIEALAATSQQVEGEPDKWHEIAALFIEKGESGYTFDSAFATALIHNAAPLPAQPQGQGDGFTLTGPDGRQWTGDSPFKVCAAAQRELIPPEVALKRIFDAAYDDSAASPSAAQGEGT